MKFLILNETQRDVIAKVNATMPDRQLWPVPLPDGRWALNADVLDDPNTWGRHLAGLAGGGYAIEWQSANGKVQPVFEADRAVVSAALADFGKAAGAVELDPAKECYQAAELDDKVVTAEIAARYEAEKTRIQNAETLKAEMLKEGQATLGTPGDPLSGG